MQLIYRISSLIIALVFLLPMNSFAQNCAKSLVSNKKVNGVQMLETKFQTLVIRGSYAYSVSFTHTDKGLFATMRSEGGVEFNQDDEIIIMDKSGSRKSYRFEGMGELKNKGGVPVYINKLRINLEAISTIATSYITTIYIKNNVSNKMRKFTLTAKRRKELQMLGKCFYTALDKSKVKDVVLDNDLPPFLTDISLSKTTSFTLLLSNAV